MSPSKIIAPTKIPVAIVGGGPAGLTVALSFEKLGIEYVLLERRGTLAPDEGASVGLLPNGLRILEQLGILDEIEAHNSPLKTWKHIDGEGNVLSTVSALQYYQEKIGYAGIFLERQQLLRLMAAKLQSTNSIRTSTRVLKITQHPDMAVLELDDGTELAADVVIGADGVRSIVRDSITPANGNFSARFACVYGISSPVAGINEGDCFSFYREKATVLGFTGADAKIFWFVFEDLGEDVALDNCPRYAETDCDAVCRSVHYLSIAEHVKFGDIYDNRRIAMKIPLEEGMARLWRSERLVLIGDSAHKMVPNAAMGANQAMESAVTLVNELNGVWPVGTDAAKDDEDVEILAQKISQALQRYEKQRLARTTMVKEKAGAICRAQLRHPAQVQIVEELSILQDGDWLLRGFMGLHDAPTLNFLDPTARAEFYDGATRGLMIKLKQRQEGRLLVSNNGLFDI